MSVFCLKCKKRAQSNKTEKTRFYLIKQPVAIYLISCGAVFTQLIGHSIKLLAADKLITHDLGRLKPKLGKPIKPQHIGHRIMAARADSANKLKLFGCGRNSNLLLQLSYGAR